MRQILFILIGVVVCLSIARLLPREGELANILRVVFYVIGAALGLLFLFVLMRAAVGGI